LRRKDHWLRWLELVATALYWWHPVVWFARRMIQRAEEQACDAWVGTAFPGAAKRYAAALFKTVQMRPEPRPRRPISASRLGSSLNLKGRIEDIMTNSWKCRLSLRARVVVAIAALAVLPLSFEAVPAAGEQPTNPGDETSNANVSKNATTPAAV